jgi:hypothetical protein
LLESASDKWRLQGECVAQARTLQSESAERAGVPEGSLGPILGPRTTLPGLKDAMGSLSRSVQSVNHNINKTVTNNLNRVKDRIERL